MLCVLSFPEPFPHRVRLLEPSSIALYEHKITPFTGEFLLQFDDWCRGGARVTLAPLPLWFCGMPIRCRFTRESKHRTGKSACATCAIPAICGCDRPRARRMSRLARRFRQGARKSEA